jgi:hypothetical protein
MEKLEKLELSGKTLESLSLTGAVTSEKVETAVLSKDMTIVALRKEVSEMQTLRIGEFLDAAVKTRRIRAAERPHYEALALKDFDTVKKILDAQPAAASASLADMAEVSTQLSGRFDWDYIRWMKEDPRGLQRLRMENPTEFDRLKTSIKK